MVAPVINPKINNHDKIIFLSAVPGLGCIVSFGAIFGYLGGMIHDRVKNKSSEGKGLYLVAHSLNVITGGLSNIVVTILGLCFFKQNCRKSP